MNDSLDQQAGAQAVAADRLAAGRAERRQRHVERSAEGGAHGAAAARREASSVP